MGHLRVAAIAGVIVVHTATAYVTDAADWYYDDELRPTPIGSAVFAVSAVMACSGHWYPRVAPARARGPCSRPWPASSSAAPRSCYATILSHERHGTTAGETGCRDWTGRPSAAGGAVTVLGGAVATALLVSMVSDSDAGGAFPRMDRPVLAFAFV